MCKKTTVQAQPDLPLMEEVLNQEQYHQQKLLENTEED